jgi:hypothetical protein
LKRVGYGDAELLIAVLGEEGRSSSKSELPEAAQDFVREFLYRIEESSDVHIWNNADVLRAAYPRLMLCYRDGGTFLAGEYPDASAVRVALKRLCTRRELAEFYERHGIEDPDIDLSTTAGSVERDTLNDQQKVMKLTRLLADPLTPEETRRKIVEAIKAFSDATQVHLYHPAIAERAATVMFESMKEKPPKGRGLQRRQAFKEITDLLEAIEENPAISQKVA